MSSKLPPYVPPSPYVPFFRRFTDERAVDLAEAKALHHEVQHAFLASLWSKEEALETFGALVIDRVSELVDLPRSEPLREQLFLCLFRLLQLETQIFDFPAIDWSTAVLSLKDQVELRRRLRSQQHFLAHEADCAGRLLEATANVFAGVSASLPELGDGPSVGVVPLHALLDASDVVDRVIGTLSREELLDRGLLAEFNDTVYRNICAVSKVVPCAPLKRPLIPAAESTLPAAELVDAYLGDTPFRDLLLTDVPFAIPLKAFREHAAVFAPSGHGKTQLLQHLICRLLEEPDPPGMVVLDSQGDMLGKIERLAAFEDRLKDRLVILDPEDEEPPALNFFELGQRAGHDAQLNELFNYLFTAIDSELTAKQGTAVTYLLKLMRALPGATIETLKDVMEEPARRLEASRYAQAVAGLDRITQDFFKNQFFDKQMAPTRAQVARRLYTILGNPVFTRMFAASENRFSALQALREQKIVLVNTSQRFLGAEASAVFGRFIIAQVLAAAYERGAVGEDALALLVVDEASEYFDAKTERILSQARKYGLGLLFATQYLEQMPPQVKAAVNGNTTIKLAGPVSYTDAMLLAREMYTTGEFIRSMQKSGSATQFAAHVRGLTPRAVALTIPFGTLEARPTMSEGARRARRAENARHYGAAAERAEESEAPASAAAPAEPPPSPDDAVHIRPKPWS